MADRGSQFYDNQEHFRKYLERRIWDENANDTIESTHFSGLFGSVYGKSILDLGCGDGSLGFELLKSGCSSYVGLKTY